jgi:hypothetical protein
MKMSNKIAYIVQYLAKTILFWWEGWRKIYPGENKLQTTRKEY